MNEYQKQAAFLKKLVMLDDVPESRAICERLSHVERSEKCLQCACRLVALIAMLGLAGIGYAAVLLPQFFDNSTHFIIRFCSALGLGSGLCFAVFLGIWYAYRRAANRIHAECRLAITKSLAARFPSAAPNSLPVVSDEPEVKVDVLRRKVDLPRFPSADSRKAA